MLVEVSVVGDGDVEGWRDYRWWWSGWIWGMRLRRHWWEYDAGIVGNPARYSHSLCNIPFSCPAFDCARSILLFSWYMGQVGKKGGKICYYGKWGQSEKVITWMREHFVRFTSKCKPVFAFISHITCPTLIISVQMRWVKSSQDNMNYRIIVNYFL